MSVMMLSTLLWADLTNRYVIAVLLLTFVFGLVGGIDDYRKLTRKNSKGLPGRWKLFWEFLAASLAATYFYWSADVFASTQFFCAGV